MSSRSYNRAFTQPGFQLGHGSALRDAAATSRICIALVGPETTNVTEMQKAVAKSLGSLFSTLVDKADLFRALRDTEIFWGTVAVNWDGPAHAELTTGDTQFVTDTYVRARRAVTGSSKKSKSGRNQETTSLMEAVDAWIEIADEVRALGPQPAYNVTIRQHPVTVASQQLADLALSANARFWPPKYLNAQECAWVADSHVSWQLSDHADSFPFEGRIDESDIPTLPDSLPYPQDVKLFLCWASMARFNPSESKVAVFMAPIAFMDEDDRKDNYVATGSLSKRMATISDFFDYALEMLDNQGRELVIGMMTYWIDPPVEYERFYGERPRTETRAARAAGYQFILYDPERDNLKQQPRQPRTDDADHDELVANLHEWREEVELVADKKLGAEFAELWWGGKQPTLLREEYGTAPGDSVSHVAAWVFDAVSGRFPALEASVDELEGVRGYDMVDTLHDPEAVKKKAREDEGDGDEEDEDSFDDEEEGYGEEDYGEESDEVAYSDSEYHPSETSDEY
ncbi:uncharacterized protein PG986_008475 [Apiospora aurea]|uniref:Uncharacterized protein n=1 Tax=Apiospora aurea TaxID=335848 RepID=A0ABR1QFK7_9PEZI